MKKSSRIKILMGMINKGLRGGPPGHLPYLVEGLELNDAEVVQIVYGARKDNENIFVKTINMISTIIEMNRAIKKYTPDIIHLNSAFDFNSIVRDFFTIAILKKYKIPFFIKTHGTNAKYLSTQSALVKFMRNKLFAWVGCFGVLSKEESLNFVKAGLAPDKIKVIKNIINSEVLRRKSDLKERYELPDDKLIILFAARFIPQKGLIDVIEACKIVSDNSIDFHLFCLGDGADSKPAKALVNAYKLNDKVTFTGYIPESDTKPYYGIANIFVFPTYSEEGFPMALFQSVSVGAAIITTPIRAAADYLSEPDNCLWVRPKDPSFLAERLIYLIKDDALRHTMNVNNLKLVNLFDKDTVAKEYLLIYDEIIEHKAF